MSKFVGAEMIGLRDKETKAIITVYPHKAVGTDEEINKAVRDWYYQKSCEAENELLTAYVDVLTEHEMKSHRK